MSWAKIVKKICSSEAVPYDGDNREGFVPSRHREPHLHCGSDFVVLTDVGHSHPKLADGRSIRPTAREVLDSLAGNDDETAGNIRRVLQALVDQY